MEPADRETGSERIRQPAHVLPLCGGLSVRYTFSAISVTNRKRGNSANQIKLYLYSSSLRKKVGKEIRLRYTTPIKKVRSAGGAKPYHAPSAEKILEGVQKLIEKNTSLRGNDLAKTSAEAEALCSRLAVFWLLMRAAFQAKYTEKSDEAARVEKMMTQVLLFCGNLDLTMLLTEQGLHRVCGQTAAALRSVVGQKAYELLRESLRDAAPFAPVTGLGDEFSVTQRTHEYAVLLKNVFREFLRQQQIPDAQQDQILNRFMRSFSVRASVGGNMGRGLRPKSLSVDNYRTLWKTLAQEPVQPLALAQLLMLFLGLTVGEVCALNAEDLLPIVHYHAYQLRIARRCIDTPDGVILSSEMGRPESYRNLPVPFLLMRLLPRSAESPEQPLLCDPSTGRRIDPKVLQTEFRALFRKFGKATIPYSQDDGKLAEIQISVRPENYRQSCHHFWQFLCGLQQNEIRYLGGLAQIDTAGRHYIDFNNAHKQYRMCVQLSYGLMAIAAPGELPVEMPGGVLEKKCRVDGVFGHVLHTRLYIRRPCTVSVKAAHGFTMKTEGGDLPWDSGKT